MSSLNDIKIVLSEISDKDKRRILSTGKEYIVFDISVFNAGCVITVICTDNYLRYQYIDKDGYSFIMESEVIINLLNQ